MPGVVLVFLLLLRNRPTKSVNLNSCMSFFRRSKVRVGGFHLLQLACWKASFDKDWNTTIACFVAILIVSFTFVFRSFGKVNPFN